MTSGCVKLPTKERPAVYKGKPNVSPLVDGQQAVRSDVPEFGWCSSSGTKCL